MGIERNIRIADETLVPWPAVRSRLLSVSESATLRMIDGELAFPDEEPSENWQELRVALSGGMVTLRKSRQGLSCVTWGNADANLARSWNLLTWAVADAVGGLIREGEAELTSVEFANHFKLFPA